ncbi:glycosyltransferase family 4 protein [Nonomuraea cavernae]|uniref:Glycosyltransferase subfamily 4-like N-terminal domain-containing protein n=1 Tax=Nonomuraea cavernae TaxID=2045107 RepID=A0A917YSL2_9ACTN|nr:glycosyltransferase family 4 protein [Nonomuraea cavernae]MCA2185147.1 glycosyltransferase family 4 protein [Nonomuraea cavernae]GGO65555.1 hypothetical protein GCM10012289_17520 [Nonomuraea cavernae]
MASSGHATLRRVVLFIGQLGFGGTETQVVLLARELRLRGIQVDVVLLVGGGPHEAGLRAAGIEVHHLVRRRRGRATVMQRVWLFARLVRLLRRLRPDVLHAFLMECYMPAAPAALLARVPVLVAGRRSLSDILRDRWCFKLGSAMVRITDHVVANAVAVAEDARTVEGVPPQKLSVIYNGLQDSAFDPVEPAGIDTGLPVVLCLARLRPEKGHGFLFDAAALLARQGRPITVVLVGDGPEEDRLRERANALGLDIRFMGAMTDSRGMLDRADIVVSPSVSEGLSNSVMEAMARGRPIVATSVGGTPELVEDRGVLVPPADPVALSQAVARLLDDPELAASLGAASRLWASKNLDVTTMVEEHMGLYHRLLEDRCAT